MKLAAPSDIRECHGVWNTVSKLDPKGEKTNATYYRIREIGCGGMIIARLVADGLDLELFDDCKFQEEAVKMGVRSEDIKDIDDRAPGFFDLLFGKKQQMYLDYTEALVYELATKSGCCTQYEQGHRIWLHE